MKVSFITTVLNEEKTIEKLLISLTQQTRKPDEIIICDGGSSDKTVEIVENYIKTDSGQVPTEVGIPIDIGARMTMKILKQVQNDGYRINRAKGRNEAIRQATGEIIVMSDAGCELDKRWVEEIVKPFTPPRGSTSHTPGVSVVAGYYQVSKDSNVFQRCVACYALVMPDKVDPENFLPSARSMAIRKSVWEKFGGFPEDFSDNEDYVFANRLKNNGAKIVFNKEAIVYWQPVANLKDFFTMIFRFARGDKKAGLRKGKIATVFGRYAAIGLISLIGQIWVIGGIGVIGYLVWAVFKNYRYVEKRSAVIYLPILQVSSDIAIMMGTVGEMTRLLRRKLLAMTHD